MDKQMEKVVRTARAVVAAYRMSETEIDGAEDVLPVAVDALADALSDVEPIRKERRHDGNNPPAAD